jgi:hypothetical protein
LLSLPAKKGYFSIISYEKRLFIKGVNVYTYLQMALKDVAKMRACVLCAQTRITYGRAAITSLI